MYSLRLLWMNLSAGHTAVAPQVSAVPQANPPRTEPVLIHIQV
jgi:hypothetical protein